MSLAALKERGGSYSVSDAARERITDARVRELSFVIKRIVNPAEVTERDVEALAQIMVEGLDAQALVDRKYVQERLLAVGRSKLKAEALSSALFK
jgi:hypothetical protein